jgi:hypothetical protein
MFRLFRLEFDLGRGNHDDRRRRWWSRRWNWCGGSCLGSRCGSLFHHRRGRFHHGRRYFYLGRLLRSFLGLSSFPFFADGLGRGFHHFSLGRFLGLLLGGKMLLDLLHLLRIDVTGRRDSLHPLALQKGNDVLGLNLDFFR